MFVTIAFMSPRRVPVSRRDRPAKPPLSRDGVMSVALRVMREEGLERVTMRRLAAELDTGPASLYVYVDNLAEMHAALLDALIADLPLPSGDDAGCWREDVIGLLDAYTRILMGHPGLARSALVLRPSGPHYLRLVDAVLGLLHAGGIPVRQAAWGVDLLLQHATATAAEQGTRDGSADADGEVRQQVSAVRDADPGDHPHLHRARDELFSGTGEQRARWAFSTLLDGLAAGRGGD